MGLRSGEGGYKKNHEKKVEVLVEVSVRGLRGVVAV